METRYTMLIVDPSAEGRAALTAYFCADYALCFSENGSEALALLAAQAVDAVTLQMAAPGLDGFALLQSLRGNPAFADLPVVAVTPADVPLQRRALGMGADGFITTDYDAAIVRILVRNIVDKYVLKVQLPKKQLAYEHVINECLRRVHSTEHLAEAVTEILAITGSYMGAERAYAFEARGEGMTCAFEWCAPGVLALNTEQPVLGMDVMRHWEAVAADRADRSYLLIENREDIRERHPEVYRLMCEKELFCVVQMQIRIDGRLRALIGYDNPAMRGTELHTFLDNVFYLIDLSTEREARRRKMLRMTYNDPLTGLLNRAAFYRDIDRWQNGGMDDVASAGIFYLDLNGLKRVNDAASHEAGDALLVRCAALLRECCPDAAIYRVGGDEFVVLLPGAGEGDFPEALRRIRTRFSDESDCCAAVGASLWLAGADFHSSIVAADHAMYRDKAEYYKLHDRRPRREPG